jgi:PKD repeat protein
MDEVAKLVSAPCQNTKPTALKLDRRLVYQAPGIEAPKAKRIFPQYEYAPELSIGGQTVQGRTFTLPAVQTGFKASVAMNAQGGRVNAEANITGGRAPYTYSWTSCSTTIQGGSERISYDVAPRGAVTGPFTEELVLTVRDADGLQTVTKATAQVTPSATAQAPPSVSAQPTARSRAAHSGRPVARSAAANTVDVGAEYIGVSQNLNNSKANAEGFLKDMRAGGVQGWIWGDSAVFESDFTDRAVKAGGNDSAYADNVDMLFYSGHGNANGFTVANGDGFVAHNEVRWGDVDVEWMVASACEVLQPNASDGTVRWLKAFHGLHLLLGYATLTADTAAEGQWFSHYLHRGYRVRDAWAAAASMVQPDWIWDARLKANTRIQVAYMSPMRTDGVTNLEDRFHGRGSVGPDIPNSQIGGYWVYWWNV